MNWLQVREAMRFGSRWQRIQTYASLAAWSALALQDDDELTWRDTPETLVLGLQLGLIWSPQIALAIGMSATPLNIVEGAVLTGAIASYAIGGVEGVETYVDYISNPQEILFDAKKRDAFLKASDVTLSLANPFHIPTKMVGEWLGENLPWGEVFRNRWVTGPVLPF